MNIDSYDKTMNLPTEADSRGEAMKIWFFDGKRFSQLNSDLPIKTDYYGKIWTFPRKPIVMGGFYFPT